MSYKGPHLLSLSSPSTESALTTNLVHTHEAKLEMPFFEDIVDESDVCEDTTEGVLLSNFSAPMQPNEFAHMPSDVSLQMEVTYLPWFFKTLHWLFIMMGVLSITKAQAKSNTKLATLRIGLIIWQLILTGK